MKRKHFIKAAGITAAMSMLPFKKSFPSYIPPEKIKPERLQPGDTIALITPGSYITGEELSGSIKNLSGLGFNVVYNNSILSKNGYFSGTISSGRRN